MQRGLPNAYNVSMSLRKPCSLCERHSFEHLPVENMVYANQQAYYDAITESSRIANSGPFIDFMLNEILSALKAHQAEDTENGGLNVGINGGLNVGINERNILTLIANSPTVRWRICWAFH